MVFRMISQVQTLIISTNLLELPLPYLKYIYMHLIIKTCKSKNCEKILTKEIKTKLTDD